MMTQEQPEVLQATIAIRPEEALQGTSRTLRLPGGQQLDINIPAGIANNDEIRLPVHNQQTDSLILRILILTPEQPPNHLHEHTTISPPQTDIEEFPTLPRVPPPIDSHPSLPTTPTNNKPTVSVPPPLPTRPLRLRQQRLWMLALTLFLSIIFASSILLYFISVFTENISTQQLNATNTLTAASEQTNVFKTTATYTAQDAEEKASATAQAHFESLYSQITSQQPILDDPLNQQSNAGWDSNQQCNFTDQGYNVTETESNHSNYCAATNLDYGNFIFQVQMQIINGNKGGILFRANLYSSQLYFLEIDNKGEYDLLYYTNSLGSSAHTLYRGETSLYKTSLPNSLAVLANNNHFAFYLNGYFLADFSDTARNAGTIGVIANNHSDPRTTVLYSQARVWTIS